MGNGVSFHWNKVKDRIVYENILKVKHNSGLLDILLNSVLGVGLCFSPA